MKKILIIGAGPIGIEAALYALKSGFDVELVEKGDIGNNIKKWGHVTLFSPFFMNSSKTGLELLKNHNLTLPDENSYQTGLEYLETYLLPLVRYGLPDKVSVHTEVLGISKKNILKRDFIGKPERGNAPFIVSIRRNGKESIIEADIIIDTSGTYDNPVNLGIGGLKIPGEEYLKDKINYHLPDINGLDKSIYSGKTTLLIGSGYSAATTLSYFSQLFVKNPQTKLIWLTRKEKHPPYLPIENDPLPLRAGLINTVNKLITEAPEQLEYYPSISVVELEPVNNSKIKVKALQNNQEKEFLVDEIIANVGYKLDNKIYQELQVHECYASQGPMKLAASLLGSSSQDCLAQKSSGPETLKTPEPNFFILGSKSYGRNSAFLIKLGLEQIQEIFTLIS